ncbi:MAG: tetratricopeptide repeat protein [Candidatus Obscuribacterales bacterium]|nr:tetratricopeptide repeat protein [Candidatus Obscuribacterales bacterium]
MNLKKLKLTFGLLAGSLTILPLVSLDQCLAHSSSDDGLLIAEKRRTLKVRIEHDVVQADDLMLKGKYGDAESMYKQALQRNKNSVPATVGYGMALAKQFKLDGAKAQFEKALQMDPRNAMAHAGLAMVMYNGLQSSSQTVRANQDAILRNAEAECKQGLAIDPGMPEAHYTLGNVYRTQGRVDEALSEYKEASRLDPEYSEAFAGVGLVNMNKGQWADAVTAFKQAIQLSSGNSTAHYGLGRTYFKQGLYDDALKELNTSLYQHRESAPVRLTRGEVYAAQGNTVAAVREFQEAISIKPETPEAYINIADIRENRGDLEDAIAQLRSGTELMPDNSVLRGRIADLSLKLEKLDQAIAEYQKVLAVDPGNGAAAQGLTRAYYMKAAKDANSSFFVSNEFEQAKASIDNAVKMNPNNMELRLAQLKLRIMMGDPVDLSQVQPPTNDGERIAYAEALLAQNKFADADQQLNTVITNAKDAKDAFAVGDLALMIKDLKNAEAAYKKGGTFPGADKRAARGLNLVAKAKDGARQDLTLADDLSKRKQLQSAMDKYHAAIYENPRVAESRLGAGKTLEQLKPSLSKDLKEAIVQYKAYLALAPELPPKEKEKIEKKIEKLQEKAFKLEQKEKGK